ncbi:Protein of unknown function [Bacillus cereus]|nr:Protein of unknown function [Bacillus cereus]SCN35605.1 Protein of unknown function [Bacillus wiedmannii]
MCRYKYKETVIMLCKQNESL